MPLDAVDDILRHQIAGLRETIMKKLTVAEKIAITKDLAKRLAADLKALPDSQFHGLEHNTEYDKVDYSLTYKRQHYFLVLLRERRQVPIKGRP